MYSKKMIEDIKFIYFKKESTFADEVEVLNAWT